MIFDINVASLAAVAETDARSYGTVERKKFFTMTIARIERTHRGLVVLRNIEYVCNIFGQSDRADYQKLRYAD